MPEKLYESGNSRRGIQFDLLCGEGWWRYTHPRRGEWIGTVVRRLEDVATTAALSRTRRP